MVSAEVVGQLMRALRHGDQGAGRELVGPFYPELRRLAAARMKEEPSAHTWQPTALVHELYLELIKTRGLSGRDYGDRERAAFFSLAEQMMKRLLIHHAGLSVSAYSRFSLGMKLPAARSLAVHRSQLLECGAPVVAEGVGRGTAMTAEQWQSALRIYNSARERPAEERRAFIVSESPDPELYRRRWISWSRPQRRMAHGDSGPFRLTRVAGKSDFTR